jgi:mono/diheme cytochrome c family protein
MPPAVPTLGLRKPKLVWVVALAGAAGALGGCGGGGEDVAKGKELFTQRCGSCHALADANTKGVIGPDLDDSFAQSIDDGLGRDTIQGVVREQIAIPQGGEMPANLVKGKDAESVAAYVAEVVGKKGKGGGGGGATQGGTQQGGSAKGNARNEVEIPADPNGQLLFEFKQASAKAGEVTLISKNDSSVPHNIALEGGGVNEEGPVVSGGKSSKVSAKLKAGRYTFYCSVPGHEQAGMKGTLNVG